MCPIQGNLSLFLNTINNLLQFTEVVLQLKAAGCLTLAESGNLMTVFYKRDVFSAEGLFGALRIDHEMSPQGFLHFR